MNNPIPNNPPIISVLHKAQRQVAVALDEIAKPHGLAGSEMHMMAYLMKYGPCPIKELSRVFGERPSTLTGVLDRLQKAGLVDRQSHPDDRRSVLVAATEGGCAVLSVCRIPVKDLVDAIEARVTPEELAGFYAVVRAINDTTCVQLRDGNAAPKDCPIAAAAAAAASGDSTSSDNPDKT